MDQRGQTVEGTYQDQVGICGKYDTPVVPGGPPPRGTYTDYHDNHPIWAGGGEGGGNSVIGLVEVIWKTITSIINTHIRLSVSLNDTLNRL